MRFWYRFLISLDRFEGHYRAGSGLFFILMTFSCLNLKKLVLRGKDLLELMFLELLQIGKFFCSSTHYCSLASGMCRQAEQNNLKSRTLKKSARCPSPMVLAPVPACQ
jgi:hypothetical protein